MKPRKDRKLNDYLHSLEEEQLRRMNNCGWNAKIMYDYQASTWHRTYASFYSNRFKAVKGEQRI